MSTTPNEKSVLNTVKSVVFPALVTILAMMIWRDVTELRSDVKALLAQSNVDKTKIDQLERQVSTLNTAVFKVGRPITSNQPVNDDDTLYFVQIEAVKPDELYDAENLFSKHLKLD